MGKIVDVLVNLPLSSHDDFLELLERDFNYVGPAKTLWDLEPSLQEMWPIRESFIGAVCYYRRKKKKKRVQAFHAKK